MLGSGPLFSMMEYSSGPIGCQPAGSLLLLPKCQNGESSEASPTDKYRHSSLSATMIDILPWGWKKGWLLFKSFLVLWTCWRFGSRVPPCLGPEFCYCISSLYPSFSAKSTWKRLFFAPIPHSSARKDKKWILSAVPANQVTPLHSLWGCTGGLFCVLPLDSP